MNQLNNNPNNNKITPRNTRKWFFILGGGIIALITLLVIIFLVKKTNSKIISSSEISPEDHKNCPYLNEAELTTIDPQRQYSKLILRETELPQWRQIPSEFIIKCWKKGYHWHDILQLWEWKLSDQEIPDLKAEQRIGVINSLSYLLGLPAHILEALEQKKISKEEAKKMMEEDKFGYARNLVVIVRKIASGGGPQIKIDKGVQGASPYGNTLKYTKKLIAFTLNQENINPTQYEVFLLNCVATESLDERKTSISIGKSFGTPIYLALLSALYQKPIAKTVASTGAINTSQKKKSGKINDQEISLVPGDNLPIAGLRGKTNAAVEKGINRLVLSTYNNSPNLLGQSYKTDEYIGNQHITERWSVAEDYSKVVPLEIREKLTVHWAKNISELRELLFQGKLS